MTIEKQDTRGSIGDDELDSLLLASKSLEKIGYSEVKEYPNGLALFLDLRKLAAEDNLPHFIILDTEMIPTPYGYEICRQIREQEFGKRIAIIGTSGDTFHVEEYKEKWLQAGADDFVDKDTIFFDRPALDEVIQNALAKYQ